MDNYSHEIVQEHIREQNSIQEHPLLHFLHLNSEAEAEAAVGVGAAVTMLVR